MQFNFSLEVLQPRRDLPGFAAQSGFALGALHDIASSVGKFLVSCRAVYQREVFRRAGRALVLGIIGSAQCTRGPPTDHPYSDSTLTSVNFFLIIMLT